MDILNYLKDFIRYRDYNKELDTLCRNSYTLHYTTEYKIVDGKYTILLKMNTLGYSGPRLINVFRKEGYKTKEQALHDASRDALYYMYKYRMYEITSTKRFS
jgi:hypothetical protein